MQGDPPTAQSQPVTIDLRDQAPADALPEPAGADTVSGLFLCPAEARSCFVFAHGAGAGMEHSFMTGFAVGLAARGVATLRYQFPFMQRSSKRVDAPQAAHRTVRAAVRMAAELAPGLPLVAGGKSFGGRMTSQAQAIQPLPRVAGIAFVGFPLHAPDKPSTARAEHLADIGIPMLFLQGTRDALADYSLIVQVADSLGTLATLHRVEHADHAFHVLVRSGRTDKDVERELLDTFVAWADAMTAAGSRKAET